jgi:uncharacterized protein (DUF924 family)
MRPEFNPTGLLDHWFADCRENPDEIAGRNAWWFAADADRDRQLARTWLGDCEAAASGQLDELADHPSSRLALILLLDQLPRNLFRGTPRAFAGDATALQLCVKGHQTGMDSTLSRIERVFFWMPLQHAEDLDLQNLGVELYGTLAPGDPDRAELWNGYQSFARLHRDIIARFGRFPHRNKVLGRTSTTEETAYLEQGAETFGQ